MGRLMALCVLFLVSNSALAHRGGWGGWGYGGGHWGGGGWRGGFGGYYGGPRFYGSGGYSGFGFYYGGPGLGWPYYPGFYPPPFYGYYPPPIIATPSSPPVYIEKNATGSPSSQRQGATPAVWHFCEASQSYYPKVQDCPSGWTEISQVPPQQEPGYWYRCPHPEGYYPYVRQCPEAWIKSGPQDSSSTPAD